MLQESDNFKKINLSALAGKEGADTKTGCGESLLHSLRTSYISKYDLFLSLFSFYRLL